jgi:hypothetical protein
VGERTVSAVAAYLFTVESDGRHGVDVLLELESVESGGFAGRVEAQHDDVDGAMGGDWQGLQKGRRCLAEASAHATRTWRRHLGSALQSGRSVPSCSDNHILKHAKRTPKINTPS